MIGTGDGYKDEGAAPWLQMVKYHHQHNGYHAVSLHLHQRSVSDANTTEEQCQYDLAKLAGAEPIATGCEA